MTVRAKDSAFLDLDEDLCPTAGPDQPANVAVFLAKVVEVKNDRIIFATKNAWVRCEVFPRQQSIALSARYTATAALDALIFGSATLRKDRKKGDPLLIQLVPTKLPRAALAVAISANHVTLVDLGNNCRPRACGTNKRADIVSLGARVAVIKLEDRQLIEAAVGAPLEGQVLAQSFSVSHFNSLVVDRNSSDVSGRISQIVVASPL